MRVEEVMALVGLNVSGREITDALLEASCPACGENSRLSDASVRETGEQTNYICPACGDVFVIVSPTPGITGGTRLGEWVVKPMGVLDIHLP